MEACDVLLYRKTNTLSSFFIWFGSVWANFFQIKPSENITHVAIANNDRQIIEANTDGIKLKNAESKYDYRIYRLTKLTEEAKLKILDYAYSRVGEEYSWWLNVCLAVLTFLHLEWAFKGIGHQGDNCSVFVAKCFDQIDYRFNTESLDTVEPNEIAENIFNSKDWQKIK